MPVLPTVTIGDATPTGAVDQVAIPVTVDPGTTTGTYTVTVSSASAAELLAKGTGWACVDATTDPNVPTRECTLVAAAPGVPHGAAVLPVLDLTVTSNQAGRVDVAVRVDGVVKATASATLPTSDPVVTVEQTPLPLGGYQLGVDVRGRFASLPAFWVWWVDDAGSVGVPTADTSDEWLCRPANSGQPTGVPRQAAKCSFGGDPRVLTTLRYSSLEATHHVVHFLLDADGVLVDTVVDLPAPA